MRTQIDSRNELLSRVLLTLLSSLGPGPMQLVVLYFCLSSSPPGRSSSRTIPSSLPPRRLRKAGRKPKAKATIVYYHITQLTVDQQRALPPLYHRLLLPCGG